MTRKISKKALLAGCAAPGPDDGQDPRYDLPDLPTSVPNRKALQVCGQAARTLAAILAHECGDEVLNGLLVESVTPSPNSARLLVTVALPPFRSNAEADPVRRHLEQARGMLRAEVAAALHRRKAPDLTFRVVAG